MEPEPKNIPTPPLQKEPDAPSFEPHLFLIAICLLGMFLITGITNSI